MINLFKRKSKQKDAVKMYKIYKTVDIPERINYIVNSEYKRMLYLAEKAALRGETSFDFILTFEERDNKYSNILLSDFITTLVNNGFMYSRHLLENQNKLTIYFSRPYIKK